MKNIGKDIKSGIIIAITFAITLGLIGSIYAAWNTIQEAGTGTELKSAEWNNLVQNVEYLKGEVAGLNEAPKNAVMAFASTTCPLGWKAADGTNDTPDLRGVFIRGANSFDNGVTYNNRDEDRLNNGSGAFTYQDDQMRAMTGTLMYDSSYGLVRGRSIQYLKGAFYPFGSRTNNYTLATSINTSDGGYHAGFDSARLGINYSGKDTHPKNVALIYCIKE